ncbi:Uncharacterised protein [Serratia quinivorans]|nr:Uncharacterised protein [Serratia quinivorans]
MHHKFIYALCLISYLNSCSVVALEPANIRLVTDIRNSWNPSVGSELTWLTCAGPGVPARIVGQWINFQVPADRRPELIAAFGGTARGDVDAANQAYAMMLSFPHVEKYPWNTTNPPLSGTQVRCSPTGGIMVAMQYGNQYSQWESDSGWLPEVTCVIEAPPIQDLGVHAYDAIGGTRVRLNASVSCDADTDIEMSFDNTSGGGVVDFGGGLRGTLGLGPTNSTGRVKYSVKVNQTIDPNASVIFTRDSTMTVGTHTASGVLTVDVL